MTKYKYTLLCILILLLQTSCKKLVEVDPPVSKIVTATAFNNDNTATSALINIYKNMYEARASYDMELQTGLYGDELTNFSHNSGFETYYTNLLSADGGPGFWSRAYNYIYQANAIIEALKNNTAISRAVGDQLSGECKFIRAFWHFYLTNAYGDVPLVTTTDYNFNAAISRIPKIKVYDQIIIDLKDAQNLLNSNFVDASDTAITSERVRPTSWAATALLARVYLYKEDYANAEAQAASVIDNNSMFGLVSDLSQVFLANSTEAIWQLQTPLVGGSNDGRNTWDAVNFILPASTDPISISPQLMSAFEVGDNRKTNWTGVFTDNTVSPAVDYYYPFKYKIQVDNDPSNTEEYTMMLRLAEQYLIRAEARAQLDNTNGALSDLNNIRERAGLGDYTGATDKNSLLAAILHERQAELFTEWGHRWFDISRTGAVDTIMGAPGNVCQFKGGTWSPNWKLFPIPQEDINADYNLTQNSGY